jgi:phage-related minor tail protein
VTSPTLFPLAKGTGLMGEAGPEAIMPLGRGAGGRLGVSADGGSAPIITFAPTFNGPIDASMRSYVQGQIAQAVKQLRSEIVPMVAAKRSASPAYLR